VTNIRPCDASEAPHILSIINDAAQAYQDTIPADRWHDPYMSLDELKGQIGQGVAFWGCESQGSLAGVMGIQDRGEVTLIRHAYVKTELRRSGIGAKLLKHLETLTAKPVLIGTWRAATWAIRFYEKRGFRLTGHQEKERLLRRYWSIPERQIEESVVLSDQPAGIPSPASGP